MKGVAATNALLSSTLKIKGATSTETSIELRQSSSNPAFLEVLIDGVNSGTSYELSTLDRDRHHEHQGGRDHHRRPGAGEGQDHRRR